MLWWLRRFWLRLGLFFQPSYRLFQGVCRFLVVGVFAKPIECHRSLGLHACHQNRKLGRAEHSDWLAGHGVPAPA
jgi:hypothetical protein